MLKDILIYQFHIVFEWNHFRGFEYLDTYNIPQIYKITISQFAVLRLIQWKFNELSHNECLEVIVLEGR
jgi:predicted metallopeptidase